MFSTEDLKTAIGATVIARRNAAARLREALPCPRRERHRVYRRGSLAGLGGHSEVNLRTRRKEGKR